MFVAILQSYLGRAFTKRNACRKPQELFPSRGERVKWQISVGRSPLIYPKASRPHSAERCGGSQSLGMDSSPLRSAHAMKSRKSPCSAKIASRAQTERARCPVRREAIVQAYYWGGRHKVDNHARIKIFGTCLSTFLTSILLCDMRAFYNPECSEVASMVTMYGNISQERNFFSYFVSSHFINTRVELQL